MNTDYWYLRKYISFIMSYLISILSPENESNSVSLIATAVLISVPFCLGGFGTNRGPIRNPNALPNSSITHERPRKQKQKYIYFHHMYFGLCNELIYVFSKYYVLVDKVLCQGGNQRALITEGITQTPTPAVPLRIPPTWANLQGRKIQKIRSM